MEQNDFLPPKGYFRKLRVYQVAEIIYDITFIFTQRFFPRGDRTVDQMVQAARSGKNNDSAVYRDAVRIRTDETVANIAIILIHQADYLLERLLSRQQLDFKENGGIREQMSRVRREFRNTQSSRSSQSGQDTNSKF